MAIVQAVLVLIIPAIWIKLSHRNKVLDFLGPVLLCYISGIIYGNLPLIDVNTQVSDLFARVCVPLAMPLLLFTLDFFNWVKNSQKSVISFSILCISVFLVTFGTALLFRERLADVGLMAGMIAGTYTGGTPNMASIGLALNAGEELFILLNGADLAASAPYVFIVFGFSSKLLGNLLPVSHPVSVQEGTATECYPEDVKFGFLSVLFSVLILGASAGMSYLVFGHLNSIFVLISLSTLAIFASFSGKIRKLKISYGIGQYLLLMFCVAIGMLANIQELLQGDPMIFLFAFIVLYGSVFLHLLAAYFLKLDRDTVIITSCAGILGPPFVGAVAASLDNKDMILPGITTGLMGYAVGNYLGLALAHILS